MCEPLQRTSVKRFARTRAASHACRTADPTYSTSNTRTRRLVTARAIEGLQYASNILGAHVHNYAGEESDFSLVVCFRRFATPLGWGSEVWNKYGKIIERVVQYPDPVTGEAFMANPVMVDRADLPNRGNTVVSLRGRGVRFAVCDAATRVISGILARATEGDADAIYEELVASLVPNARFVPAGVLTVTRAQEYGYSLLTAGL